MPTIHDMKQALKVSRHNLDVELERQPQLYFTAAEECAAAINRKDSLKADISAQEAKAYKAHRHRLEQESEKKPTEGQVNAAVAADKNVRAAREAYLAASEEAALWNDMKEAFIQRGHALKQLAALAVSGYYQTSAAREEPVEAEEPTETPVRKKRGKVKRRRRSE